MGEILRNTSVDLFRLNKLRARLDEARARYFNHSDPGNLSPAERDAFHMEQEAYLWLLRAAQRRFDAEEEMQHLLAIGEGQDEETA